MFEFLEKRAIFVSGNQPSSSSEAEKGPEAADQATYEQAEFVEGYQNFISTPNWENRHVYSEFSQKEQDFLKTIQAARFQVGQVTDMSSGKKAFGEVKFGYQENLNTPERKKFRLNEEAFADIHDTYSDFPTGEPFKHMEINQASLMKFSQAMAAILVKELRAALESVDLDKVWDNASDLTEANYEDIEKSGYKEKDGSYINEEYFENNRELQAGTLEAAGGSVIVVEADEKNKISNVGLDFSDQMLTHIRNTNLLTPKELRHARLTGKSMGVSRLTENTKVKNVINSFKGKPCIASTFQDLNQQLAQALDEAYQEDLPIAHKLFFDAVGIAYRSDYFKFKQVDRASQTAEIELSEASIRELFGEGAGNIIITIDKKGRLASINYDSIDSSRYDLGAIDTYMDLNFGMDPDGTIQNRLTLDSEKANDVVEFIKRHKFKN